MLAGRPSFQEVQQIVSASGSDELQGAARRPVRPTRRMVYHLGLRFTATLMQEQLIDHRSQALLKEAVLDDDPQVLQAVSTFIADGDPVKIMQTFIGIASK